MQLFADNPSLASLPAAADTEPFLLVKLSTGQYAVAAAADTALGVTTRRVKAGEAVAPRRPSAGSLVCTASGVIAAGGKVETDASGKVRALRTSGGGTGVMVGVAMTAAAADGDWITIEPLNFGAIVTIPA